MNLEDLVKRIEALERKVEAMEAEKKRQLEAEEKIVAQLKEIDEKRKLEN